MTRALLAALALLVSTAIGAAPPPDRGLLPNERVDRVPLRGLNANPTALIAAEFAIFRRAQDKGLWKALRETAAAGAVMFEPGRVDAESWLKTRKQAAAPIRYSALRVWMSCDGGLGLVAGNWQQEEASGRFVTVWQRQEKGDFKWLLKRRDSAPFRSDGLDIVEASIANCGRMDSLMVPPALPEGATGSSGASDDKSLHWREFAAADGSWNFELHSWDGTAFPQVFSYAAPPEP